MYIRITQYCWTSKIHDVKLERQTIFFFVLLLGLCEKISTVYNKAALSQCQQQMLFAERAVMAATCEQRGVDGCREREYFSIFKEGMEGTLSRFTTTVRR